MVRQRTVGLMATDVQSEQTSEATHSGRLMVRMPPTLHTELAQAAEEEGVSLNAFITGVLAGSVGWRAPADGGAEPPAWARRTLVINLVVMGVLAVAAAALVVVALVNG
jgi:hypothetical protein